MWEISITKIKCDPRYDHGLKGSCALDIPVVHPILDTDAVFLYKTLMAGDEFVGVCSAGDLYAYQAHTSSSSSSSSSSGSSAAAEAFYRVSSFEVGIRSLSEVDDSSDKVWEDLDSLRENIVVLKRILATPTVTISG